MRSFIGSYLLSLFILGCTTENFSEDKSNSDVHLKRTKESVNKTLSEFNDLNVLKTSKSFWKYANNQSRGRISICFSDEDFSLVNIEPSNLKEDQKVLQFNLNDKMSFSNHSSKIEGDTIWAFSENYNQRFFTAYLIEKSGINANLTVTQKDYLYIDFVTESSIKGSIFFDGMLIKFKQEAI